MVAQDDNQDGHPLSIEELSAGCPGFVLSLVPRCEGPGAPAFVAGAKDGAPAFVDRLRVNHLEASDADIYFMNGGGSSALGPQLAGTATLSRRK